METENNDVFLTEAKEVSKDLSVRELVEEAIRNGEATFSDTGALRTVTGKHTGRSPKDKFIVDTPMTHKEVSWSNNQPCSEDTFNKLYKKCLDYVKTHKVYATQVIAGADSKYQLKVRFITQLAWQQLFIKQLLIKTQESCDAPADFTVVVVPDVKADPKVDGTYSDAFVILNFDKKIVLIGGGRYAGELKKSIFSVMNFLLPEHGILTMHCSCNEGAKGDVALFFGLSGTGKTTLSADPNRALIGDDEHGWGANGVFNIEGGCYAKCIDLTEESEPEIYRAIKFGAVMENVIVDPKTGKPDYSDSSLTQNTRVAYPLDYIPNAKLPSIAAHPKNIIFLTADAFGVLPPVAKLTTAQAMYHYLSGYTSKVAGTETGITDPETTFSIGFGEPFLPLSPLIYAKLLGERITKYHANVYLVNTGWSGGVYGVGKRMKLAYTRAIITAIFEGTLGQDGWEKLSVFDVEIPKSCPNVPAEILNPKNTWQDKASYDEYIHKLALRFNENTKRFAEDVTPDILAAGPKI